jgi:hypothetical protein
MNNLMSEKEQTTEKARRAFLEKVDRKTIADDFAMYTTRQNLVRFMAIYEVFKRILHTKGSIVQCGVHKGGSLMFMANLCAIYEPYGYTRNVIGFDTFEGFPHVDAKDGQFATVGAFSDANYDLIKESIALFDGNRPIGHVPKVELVKGDAVKTIPQYIADNPHLLVSLLHLDFDLYEPTKVALQHFLPRMPKGALIVFDELGERRWQGETTALLETLQLNDRKIESFVEDPHVCYITI